MTRRREPVVLLATFALATTLAFGCVTPTGESGLGGAGGHVVERSKPEAPPWTSWATGRLHESDAVLSYVELGSRLRDLPLGLKTTQLGAVDASRNALAVTVRERLEDDRGRLTVAGQAELDRRIVEAAADVHSRFAKVGDIYYEKVSSDDEQLPEYFNAFVLVSMPKERLIDVYEGLGRRLSGAQDPGLRQLGQSLLARVKAGGMSH